MQSPRLLTVEISIVIFSIGLYMQSLQNKSYILNFLVVGSNPTLADISEIFCQFVCQRSVVFSRYQNSSPIPECLDKSERSFSRNQTSVSDIQSEYSTNYQTTIVILIKTCVIIFSESRYGLDKMEGRSQL